jgi:hypothetical protein
VPESAGDGFEYFTRRVGDRPAVTFLRRRLPDGPEQTILDVNTFRRSDDGCPELGQV